MHLMKYNQIPHKYHLWEIQNWTDCLQRPLCCPTHIHACIRVDCYQNIQGNMSEEEHSQKFRELLPNCSMNIQRFLIQITLILTADLTSHPITWVAYHARIKSGAGGHSNEWSRWQLSVYCRGSWQPVDDIWHGQQWNGMDNDDVMQ